MNQIEFKPPPGLVPEGAAEGTTFDEVATFRVKANGDICLIAIGDHQMKGYSNPTKSYGEEAASRYAEKMEE